MAIFYFWKSIKHRNSYFKAFYEALKDLKHDTRLLTDTITSKFLSPDGEHSIDKYVISSENPQSVKYNLPLFLNYSVQYEDLDLESRAIYNILLSHVQNPIIEKGFQWSIYSLLLPFTLLCLYICSIIILLIFTISNFEKRKLAFLIIGVLSTLIFGSLFVCSVIWPLE